MSMLVTVVYVSDYSFFFFFSSRRRHTRCLSDWSSDVCSSDLRSGGAGSLAQPDLRALHTLEVAHLDAAVFRDDIDELVGRSEERRVGKECRSRWSPYH